MGLFNIFGEQEHRTFNYKRTKSPAGRAQNIIGLVGLALVVIVLIYIAKFYTLL